jgi:hypothetical protein
VHTTSAPPPWQAAMRAEVLRLVREAGSTRRLLPRCWVGRPGEDPTRLPDVEPGHRRTGPHEVRAALVERALDGLERPEGALGWVTRSGELGAGDAEVAWWAAARDGFARHGLPLEAFCVLNRYGWTDLVSGAGRTWTRLRP